MRPILLFLILALPSTLHAQRSLPAAKKEIDAFKKELKRLKGLYQKAVVKARTDLDLKLSTLAKKYVDEGKTDWVKRIEAEKARIQLSNPVEKRLDLENAVAGRIYKFDERDWIFRFDTDGYIYLAPGNDPSDKRFPWVALSESEVLYANELGKPTIINFSTDRKKFNLKIFVPQKSVGNNRATRIK